MRGWTESKHDDLCSIIAHYDPDVVTVCETWFLSKTGQPRVPNYYFFINNCKEIHRRAPHGSGSVGILIHERLLQTHRLHEVIDIFDGLLAVPLNINILMLKLHSL